MRAIWTFTKVCMTLFCIVFAAAIISPPESTTATGASIPKVHEITNDELEIERLLIGNLYKLVFVSKLNNMVIRDVAVNQGNCKPSWDAKLPRTLRYGDRMEYGFFYPCVPIKVDVLTTEGVGTFTFLP